MQQQNVESKVTIDVEQAPDSANRMSQPIKKQKTGKAVAT